MDKKVYEKTRYQNIYRHKKNKNYLIMISKPVKTSIAEIDGEKIFKLDVALKVRDNPIIRYQKALETKNKESFDDVWYNYIDWCKYNEKQEYNTILRKQRTYNKYLKNSFDKVSKIKEKDLIWFIEKQKCSLKQRNQIIKDLKAFFNWCVRQKILLYSPMVNIKKYKVAKPKMKYWTQDEIETFFKSINKDISFHSGKKKEMLYRTKIMVMIGIAIGDRIGETRALTFNCFDAQNKIVYIEHSIKYNKKENDYLGNTKTYHSQREVDVTDTLIKEIKDYKWYLINDCGYDIETNELIFCNHDNKVPLSDVALRKQFYNCCDNYNISRIRMYDLRHTFATIMMSEEKDPYLFSEIMGHKSIKTTIDNYGHIVKNKRKEMAKITDKFFE